MDSTPSPMHTFGVLLRQFRTASGLTQEALAARAGISVYSISNLERDIGHAPRKDTLALLADALSLSPDQCAALKEAADRLRLRTMRPLGATAMSATPHTPTAATREPSPCQAPIPPTPLIGREHELAALRALLHEQATDRAVTTPRLLTLCGPPGVGKTRLALEVAHALAADYSDGVAWVSLAPLRDAALVAGAIAQALDIRQQGVEPVAALLGRYLKHSQALLLLDNFEHVLSAAPLVADLLAACPGVRILVTSRAPLHLRAEQEFLLDPLPLPESTGLTPRDLTAIPAVALFVARAQAISPTFTLTSVNAPAVTAICQRLDGLPLAIELAAARLRILSPAALLALLEHRLPLLIGGAHDLPVHQQTLRGALAWSYNLLGAEEQALFRRLAVFVGGIPLSAIEPVCAGVEAVEANDGEHRLINRVASLVDHGLALRLQDSADTPRFGLLETIREFGLEQLQACGEAEAIARAHAVYYLELAEAAQANLHGVRHLESLEWFAQEHGNLRAALAWALTSHDTELGLRLVGALWRFWYEHGRIGEGRALMAALLRQVEEGGSLPQALRPVWAKALTGAGNLAIEQGDYVEAIALFERALDLRRAEADAREVAAALNGLGMALAFSGAFTRAQALLEESLLIRRQLGDTEATARALGSLGRLMVTMGACARAAALYEESVLLYRQTANRIGLAMTLNDWAEALRMQGETRRPTDVGMEGLTLFRAFGHTFGTAVTLETLGSLAYQAGEYERAMEYGQESVALHRQTGHWEYLADTLSLLGLVSCAREQHEQAAAFLAEALQIYQEYLRSQGNGKTCCRLARLAILLGEREQAAALYRASLETERALGITRDAARCLEGLARVACARGDYERAARLEGAAAKQREAMGTPLPPYEHAVMERAITGLRRRLGAVRFESVWGAGRAMRLEQAIAEALEETGAIPTEEPVPEPVPGPAPEMA